LSCCSLLGMAPRSIFIYFFLKKMLETEISP